MEKTRTHRKKRRSEMSRIMRKAILSLSLLLVIVLVLVILFQQYQLMATIKLWPEWPEKKAPTNNWLGEEVWHIYPGEVVAGTFSLDDSSLPSEARVEACQAVEFRLHGWIVIQPNRGAVVHRGATLTEVELELVELGWRTYRTAVYSVGEFNFKDVRPIGY